MKRERYSIIYSSKTGNTKKLAEAIYNTLPQNKCDYYGTVDKIDDVLSNVIYIGFWTEQGNADAQNSLGYSYEYGEGVDKNLKEARDSKTRVRSFTRNLITYWEQNNICKVTLKRLHWQLFAC